jgi:Mn-dependent DtxR family transcriptional regulator
MKRSLDYLLLFYNKGKPLQLKEVSIALNVKPPSALETLNNLVKKGYLKKVKRGTFIITEKGEDYIREIIWKHAVLEHLFLNFNLGTKKFMRNSKQDRRILFQGYYRKNMRKIRSS